MSAFRMTLLGLGGLAAAGMIGAAAHFISGGAGPGAAECPGGMAGAAIGGPFTLVSHTGETVTADDLKGEAALVYFGYAFCPDVCPTDLANVAAAAGLLEERGAQVRPVFISIDPERDTPEALSEYAPYFHDRMLGLTGAPEQVAQAAQAYRVYYQKAPDEDFPDGYLMDHSSYVYLIDADGAFVTFFRHGTPPQEMAETTACHLGV